MDIMSIYNATQELYMRAKTKKYTLKELVQLEIGGSRVLVWEDIEAACGYIPRAEAVKVANGEREISVQQLEFIAKRLRALGYKDFTIDNIDTSCLKVKK